MGWRVGVEGCGEGGWEERASRTLAGESELLLLTTSENVQWGMTSRKLWSGMLCLSRLRPHLDSASALHLLNVLNTSKLCFAVGAAGLDGELGVLLYLPALLNGSQFVRYRRDHSMSTKE